MEVVAAEGRERRNKDSTIKSNPVYIYFIRARHLSTHELHHTGLPLHSLCHTYTYCKIRQINYITFQGVIHNTTVCVIKKLLIYACTTYIGTGVVQVWAYCAKCTGRVRVRRGTGTGVVRVRAWYGYGCRRTRTYMYKSVLCTKNGRSMDTAGLSSTDG